MDEVDQRIRVATNPAKLPEARLRAIDQLVRSGEFDTVERVLPDLVAIPEIADQARRLGAVARQLKRWGVSGQVEAYRDPLVRPNGETTNFDAGDEVMIVRRPGARKVIFVFTGNARQIWLSIHLFHQILPEDCAVVYLQDIKRMGYVIGLEALGDSYSATLDGMRRLVDSLGSPEVFVIGSSTGGWSALRFALDLGATRVLGLSVATDIAELVPHQDAIARFFGYSDAEVLRRWPPGGTDLMDIYAKAPRRPELLLAYGGDHLADRENSRRMAALPGVSLHEVEGYDRHDIMAELLATGAIRGLIDALVRPAEAVG